MKNRMLIGLATAAGLLLSPVAMGTADAAAMKASTVTIKVSSVEAPAGSTVTVEGKAAPRSAGSRVMLQKRVGAKWATVKSDRLDKGKTYDFTVTVTEAKTVYRVVAPSVATAKLAASRTVAVRPAAQNAPVAPLTAELLSTYQAEMLADLNAYRASNGLAPVSMRADTNAVAQARATARYNGSTAGQGSSLADFGGLLGAGEISFCEGVDSTPANGPDAHANPSYLIEATTAAFGYYYDGSGSDPVWTLYVFTAQG